MTELLATGSVGRQPRNFVAHLRALAERRPHDVWLTVVDEVDGVLSEQPFTYAVFERRVRALAARLQQQFAKGDRALVMLDNGDHYAVSMLACFYCGVIAVPVFPPESTRPQHLARLTGVAADSQARCVLTSSALSTAMSAAGNQFGDVQMVAVDAVDIALADAWQPFEPSDDDVAFLQYTSGSTSAPKGVIVTHGNLMANEHAIQVGMGIGPDDKFVSWAPLYHDMGLIGGLMQPLYSGIPLVLMSPRYFLERPVRWLELISRHRATLSGGPDFSFRLCLERVKDAQIAQLDLSTWRVAYTGAEPVRADTEFDFIERFAPAGFDAGAVYACYGLAEATLFVTGGQRGAGMVARGFDADGLAAGKGAPSEGGTLLVGCGAVAVDHVVEIVDPATLSVVAEPGRIGEIWVSGASIGGGYWGKPRESVETFVERAGRRWLRTGDLGFVCDGELYVTGRIKDLIIVRGHNIYPQDIERVIEAEVDAVRKGRVAVFAASGPDGEGIGAAAEVSRSMQKLVPPQVLVEALSAAVSEVFGEALSAVLLLNPGGMPKTTSGKLQRSACRAGWLDRSADAYAIYERGVFVKGGPAEAQAEAPVLDEVERAVDTIWREVLRAPSDKPFARDAHFFTRGGSSLTATQAAARISSQWEIVFPARMLFEKPRLHECATAVREQLALGAPAAHSRPVPIATLPAARRQQALPLSHAQERQWFLWQLDPQSAAYHMSGALRLAGLLDLPALQAALGDLVARHESLRTTFRVGPDGTAAQWIAATGALPLALIDLRGLPAGEQDARLAHETHRLKSAPFDLAQGRLLRAALIRTADDSQVLAVVMHHIVSDGASMQVLIDELAAGYLARLHGSAAVLPATRVQYADYAVWQREWLAAGEGERQLAWWRSQLGEEHPVLELRTDRPRQPEASYRAARHAFELPASLLGQLRGLAQADGTTLFMVLLAGLQVLLHRHTGQQDIRIGTAIANRNRVEFENVIGLFVNTLVLRNAIDGRTSLARALAQAREAVLGAQAHQDLPFEQLVQALQPERSMSRSPLFQVMFNHLFEDHRALERLGGIAVSDHALPDLQAQFELVLEARERPDGRLKLDLIYAAELFDAQSIERMAGHYVAILNALASRGEQAVGDVDLLGASEKAQLAQWSVNTHREPGLQPVHRLIEGHARSQPQATALLFADEALSFFELNRRANRLAHRLISLGVGPDVLVGIAMERSVEMVVGILAILKAGGAYLPLDPEYPTQRLAYMVEDSGIELLLTHRATRDHIASREGLTFLEVEGLDLANEPESDPNVALHGEHLAYVIYTSGSTGRPKGAAIRHDALHSCMAWMQRVYGLGREDTVLHKAPFGFDVSCWELFWPMTAGARLVVANPGDHRDPERLVQLIQRHQITTLNFVPAMLQAFLAHPGIEASTRLKHIICGGEAMPSETQKEALQRLSGATLQNLYGPTETTIHVTRWTCRDDGQALVPIGQPISDTQGYVLDAELNLVPRGVAGELYLGGVSLARGYLNKPGLSAERFVADPFGSGGRLYRTGDLVRWNGEGQIEYLGRIDHQVKIRGFRIELGEIEAQLLSQPEVREAVVVAGEGPLGARLVGYVSAHAGREIGSAELRQRLAEVLPDYMVPSTVVVLDALPLNANGKVDRKALPEPGLENAGAYEAPQGEVEEALAAIWADVLGVARVGRNDGFFELGGHSLLALRLLERVRALDWSVQVRTLFQHPQLAAFAQALVQGADGPKDREVVVPPNGIPANCKAIEPQMVTLIDLDAPQIARIESAVQGGAINIQDIYPLAPLQEGMLFHHLLQAEGDAYVTPLGLSFDSRQRLERFIASFNQVIARHDILRTAVLWEGLKEPVQVVQRHATLNLQWLQDVDMASDIAGQLAAHVHPSHYRIDVRQAPMIRAVAAHDDRSNRWLLQLPSHHLVLDHTTLDLLVEEIALIEQGRQAELPEPVPFRRFVAQARLGVSQQEHEAFFRRMLGDVDEPTAPFNLLDVQGDGTRVHEARLRLAPELAQQVRREAQRHGVGAATLFHLAWALVLGKATGKDDVVFGTVLFGRMQGGQGAERAVGLFINTLPLRIRLGTRSVLQCVKQTHEALAQLLHHEHAGLSLAQRCTALPGGTPLFSALLNYRFNPRPVKSAKTPLGEGMEVLGGREFTNYPFDMSVDDVGDGFELVALIDQAVDAQRVCGLMHAAIASIARALEKQPAQLACDLDLVPASQKHQLAAWGVNPQGYDDAQPVHRLFERHAKETPEAPALVFGDATLSYAELNARANRLAHRLIELGVKPEHRVGIAVERSVQMMVGLLAILKAGGAYVPLDPAYPADRLAYMVGDSGISLLLTQSHIAGRLASSGSLPTLALDALDLSAQPAHDPQVALHRDGLAYLIYTSGSTGRPKGVGISHGALVQHAQESIRFFGLVPSDRVLQFSTLNFDGFIEQTFPPLAAGAAIVLRGPALWDSETFYRELIDKRISVADLTTAYWLLLAQDFARHGARPYGALRQVHAGGEAMPPEGLNAWRKAGLAHIALLNTYGPTEATVTASVLDCAPYLQAGDEGVPSRMPIGVPLAGRALRVVGPDFSLVPQGAAGELCIGGALLARGYLGRPGLSAERFVADPFDDKGGRLYRTGDLVRWNEQGQLEYLGRIDHQVKIRGFRIELGEIEAQLLSQPEVREAVVVAGEGPLGARLVGYVSAHAGREIGSAELRQRLGEVLPDYMVPSTVVVLDALPLNANGKVDRKALPEPGLENAGAYEAPQGEVEEVLAAIWADVLGVARVGRNDGFFELGGHSLLALRLLERVRTLGWSVQVRTLFQHPQLAAFAQALTQERQGNEVVVPANGIPAGCKAIEPQMVTLIDLDAPQIARIESAVQGGAPNIQDIYPLAPLQEGMLFHHLLQTEGDAYVTPLGLSFDSRQRLERFIASFNQVIARHDILRTAVLWEGLKEPVQVVQRSATLTLQWLQDVDMASDVAAQLAAHVHPSHYRIDVCQAPMIRAIAAHDDRSNRWLLQLPSHHLVLDHTTLDLLVEEIALIERGREAELPEPVPFRRFVAQARLGVSQQEHEAFFRRMLGDVDEPTAPFNLLDVQGDGTRVHEAKLRLAPELAQQVRREAQRHGVGAATLFHLAWALVLGKATGKDDVVFGTVLFGRMQGGEGTDRAWGMFINTLPLRVKLGARDVAHCVKQTHDALTQLLHHEHASLALAQRCTALPGGAPLFSALLNYRYTQEQAEGTLLLEGMEVLGADERTNYPLTLSIDDLGEGFELVAQIHEPVKAAYVCGLVHSALEGIVDALAKPAVQPVCEIDPMPAQEKQQLAAWSAYVQDRGDAEPLHRLIERQAALHPEAPALSFEAQALGYGELNRRANRLAHHLIELGVRPETRVGVAVERGIELVVALLGILKAGGAYVPLDPEYPADRIAYMVQDSRLSLVLAQSHLQGSVALPAGVAVLPLDTTDFSNRLDTNPSVALSPDNLAYVIYTSGSTGRPKGAQLCHRNVTRLLSQTNGWFSFGPKDVWTMFHSYAFDFSVWEIFGALCTGGKLVVVPYWVSRSPEDFLQLLRTQRVTVLNQTPSAFGQLASLPQALSEPLALRVVIFGGEALEPQRLRGWIEHHGDQQPQLVNMYGITETTVHVTYRRITAADIGPQRSPVGLAIPDLGLRVLDAQLNPVPLGVAGELHVSGEGLARGYLNRAGLTAERFIAAEDGSRLYRTGDLVRWNAQGQLDYLGRIDHQVKVRGFRIELGEIEAQLLAQPEVREATVIAREQAGATMLVAYLSAQANQAIDTPGLRVRLGQVLPDYMVPAAFVVLPTLPLNANGKVDRKALPEPERASERAYEAPQGEIERALAAIWCEVLGMARVGRHDDFFELGGHSLMSVQMVARVESAMHAQLSIMDIFQHPTLGGMAALINGAGQKKPVADALSDIDAFMASMEEAA
jgi:amino acid adenylation domain-containing protein